MQQQHAYAGWALSTCSFCHLICSPHAAMQFDNIMHTLCWMLFLFWTLSGGCSFAVSSSMCALSVGAHAARHVQHAAGHGAARQHAAGSSVEPCMFTALLTLAGSHLTKMQQESMGEDKTLQYSRFPGDHSAEYKLSPVHFDLRDRR